MDPTALAVAIIAAVPTCGALIWSVIRDVRKQSAARAAAQDAFEDRTHQLDVEVAVLKMENKRLEQENVELRRRRREDFGRGH